MRRFLTAVVAVAAVGTAVAFAPTAAANSYAVSIGTPGFAFGYSNRGGYVSAYAPPPVYYAPAPVYEPYYYGPPVVYGYYGPYYHHRYHHYYRHW